MSKEFSKCVCVGDYIEIEEEGFTLKATVQEDSDTKPTDFDCYSEKDIKAWRNDDWFYCGLVLSVSYKGLELSTHAASCWGLECNIIDNNLHLTEMAHELKHEAIEEGKKELQRIRELLA
jgi:hypothetical protein